MLSFDVHWGDFFVGHVGAGFLIGFIVALLAEFVSARWRFWRLRRKADIVGRYTSYLFRADYSDQVDYESGKSAEDVIIHERENVFKLIHTEANGNVWEGTIYLTSPRDGRLVWFYTKLNGESPTTRHRMGFKRCIVKDGLDKHKERRRIVYLIGERPDHGNEYLERQ